MGTGGWDALIGVGRVVHDQNQQRDEYERQQATRDDEEKTHNFNAAVQTLHDAATDPNATPVTKDIATKHYLDFVSRGRKGVKDTDFKNAWAELGQANLATRKASLQKTLGLKDASSAAEGAASSVGSAPGTVNGKSSPGIPGGPGTVVDASYNAMHAMLQHIIGQQPQGEPSSELNKTSEEQSAEGIRRFQMQKEAEAPYQMHEVPAGGTLVRGDGSVAYQSQPKLTEHDKVKATAIHEYVLNHPELGLKEPDVETRGFTSRALQEYADKVNKTKVMGGGKHAVVQTDPFTGEHHIEWVDVPVTAVRADGSSGGSQPASIVPNRPTGVDALRVDSGGNVSGGEDDGGGSGGGSGNVASVPSPVASPGSSTSTATPTEKFTDWKGTTGQPFSVQHTYTPDQEHKLATIAKVHPAEESIVRGLLDYTIAPPTGAGMRNPALMIAMADAKRIDPSFDSKQYKVRADLIKSFSVGKDAEALKSLNQAISHLNEYMNAVKELNNPSWKPLGFAENLWGSMNSDPRLTAVRDALTATSDEASNLFKATGSTDSSIQHWREGTSMNAGLGDQMKHAIDLIQLMKGRVSSIVGKWNRTMGPERNWQALDPESVAILNEHGLHPEDLDPSLSPNWKPNAPGSGMVSNQQRPNSSTPTSSVPSVPSRNMSILQQIQKELEAGH